MSITSENVTTIVFADFIETSLKIVKFDYFEIQIIYSNSGSRASK